MNAAIRAYELNGCSGCAGRSLQRLVRKNAVITCCAYCGGHLQFEEIRKPAIKETKPITDSPMPKFWVIVLVILLFVAVPWVVLHFKRKFRK